MAAQADQAAVVLAFLAAMLVALAELMVVMAPMVIVQIVLAVLDRAQQLMLSAIVAGLYTQAVAVAEQALILVELAPKAPAKAVLVAVEKVA